MSISELKLDAYRWTRKADWLSVLHCLFTDRAFRVIAAHRVLRSAKAKPRLLRWLLVPLAWIFYRRSENALGFELPAEVQVGPGLRVFHGWGLIINNDVSIGKNVTLMHGVTLGSTRRGVPTIEDDVIVAAGAMVLGPVKVGKGSIVGAGCVVTKDVAPYTVVVGNPQRVIKDNHVPRIVNSISPCLPIAEDFVGEAAT